MEASNTHARIKNGRRSIRGSHPVLSLYVTFCISTCKRFATVAIQKYSLNVTVNVLVYSVSFVCYSLVFGVL